MSSPRLLLALCLPLVLTACSDSDSSSATPSPTSSVSTSPTPQASLPIATSYVVTAGPGVSDKELKAAVVPLSKLPGVVGVGPYGPHQLRVDLTMAALPDGGAALFKELRKLGTISVPK